MKDMRSEWRGDPLIHRSQRSRSPLMSYKRQQRPQMRPHRFSGPRSGSRERGQDHILRRSDHGMELVHNHSPPPQHRYRSLSPLSSRDDGFRYQHNYILPDHPSVNPSWKISQSIKDREFHSPNEALPPSSLDIEEQGMLRQKSTFIGEGSSRSLYVDHPMGSTVLSSDRMRRIGDSFGMGIQEVEMHSYNDGLRAPHDDTDGRHIHSRDLFLPKFPSCQLRPFSSTSSSSILKEEVKGLHRNPIPDGLGTGISRYPNDPLEYYTYNEVPKPDPLRHGLLDESRIYDYDEQPRGLDDHPHRFLDEPYKMMPPTSRIEFRNATSSTILEYPGDWMDKDDSTKRNLTQRTFSDSHHYLHRDVPHYYEDVRAPQELLAYSGNWHGELKSKSLRDYESMPFEEGFASEQVFLPISHRDEYRNRKSLLSDHDLDEHRLSMSTHDRPHMDGLGDYDIERMESRNYGMIKNIDDTDPRALFMNDRHSFAPYESEEMWPTEEPVEPSLSKSRLREHFQYRKPSRSRGISTSDSFMLSSGASSKHAESGLNINLKRRLKHTRSDFHTPYFSERREDLLKSNKYFKRGGMQYRLGVQGRGTHDSDAHVVKNDPPEDSEEFKQQVHKAFLRYSKLLNENQHNQRIYQTQGNTSSLLCTVCGSDSKEFVDTNSLVSHSYYSRKAGLKTEHLGFHKAVCVLLGWNWRVRPENSRAYQSMPVAEAKAMREDLILWPPLVIIHNILIGDNSSTKDARIVTVESLEKRLRDMGFGGAGKIRINLGKHANQSIFTVKFMPTFSGLQAAERLHKHFADKKRGREEFRQQISPRGNSSSEGDEFLYGYIAVAEDLYKLDPETKKRSLLKSKKDDIEAIADAPLNTH